MFTGIIETIGVVQSTQRLGGDLRIQIGADGWDWQQVQLGDSIATNGVCLTVVALPQRAYVADVSVETLDHTTIGSWVVGQKVNLEKALTPETRLGGHMVSGHVDGLGEVLTRSSDARSERFVLRAPAELAKYIAQKGSIAVDGISLTVNGVKGRDFDLNIVPHTLSHTNMGAYQVGTRVNLEVDVIARYLERLVMGDAAADPHATTAGLSEAFLAEHGFKR